MIEETQPKTTIEETKDLISKRLAAIEVLRQGYQTQTITLAAIGVPFLAAITYIFNTGIGTGVLAINSVLVGFLFMRKRQHILDLERKYNIDKNQVKIKLWSRQNNQN